MSDFQVAMALFFALALVFALAWITQSRRPAPVVLTKPRERVDMLDERLSAIEALGRSIPRVDIIDERLSAIEGWAAQTTPPGPLGRSIPRVDIIDKRLSDIEGWAKTTDHNVNNIRAAIGALPTRDAVHKLEVDMATVAGKVELNHALAVATSRAVERIESHLIKGTP